MGKRILSEHFEKSLQKLLAFYNHSGLAKHGDIKGLAREGFVKLFLSDNLPSILELKTGEIIDKNDNRSGQVDIILQSAMLPKINLFGELNLSFNDYTMGAIEIKSELNKDHLEKSFDLFYKIKLLARDVKIKGFPGWKKGLPLTIERTPCFLVAYKGIKEKTLLEHAEQYAKNNNLKYDDFCPEVITVLKEEYNLSKNDGWIYNPNIDNNSGKYYCGYKGKECLVDLYQYIAKIIEDFSKYQDGFMPIGQFFKEK